MKVGGLSVRQTARQGQMLSGILVRVVARKTKVWTHQGRTAVGEWRPWPMARMTRTSRAVTLRAGARGALTKKTMTYHQQIQHPGPEEPEWSAY